MFVPPVNSTPLGVAKITAHMTGQVGTCDFIVDGHAMRSREAIQPRAVSCRTRLHGRAHLVVVHRSDDSRIISFSVLQ